MKEVRELKQIKIYTLCEIISGNMNTAYPLAVFDDIDLLTTYREAIKSQYSDTLLEFDMSEQWLDIPEGKDSLDSSSFNLELNPVFDNDIYLKLVEKNTPKGENKARILEKKKKTSKNNDNVDDLVGIKISKKNS